jgi:hypothetical protein
MWLIERHTDGLDGARIPLPAPLKTALVRWYVGEGNRSDEEAGIMLVQQARIGAKWIACDCLGSDGEPPILTPAFLSEAETYYVRRLTGPKRAEHLPDCPFFRDQATNRITQVRNPTTPADPPTGYFEVLRPAPEKLAQRPDGASSDDRTRDASMPRLARLLSRLLHVSALNMTAPIANEPAERSIVQEFRALSAAAAKLEVAPGIELGRALSRGHAPQGFLTIFAPGFRGTTIHPAGADPFTVVNRVQTPSVRGNPVKGPFLIIVVIGEYPEAHGYAPLRAYAQPIFSGNRLVPVESEFERTTMRALLATRPAFDHEGVDIAIEKPIFDTLTTFGACRPDFLLEARSRRTGEIRKLVVEASGHTDDEFRAAKVAMRPRLTQIAPVVSITPADVDSGRVGDLLNEALSM